MGARESEREFVCEPASDLVRFVATTYYFRPKGVALEGYLSGLGGGAAVLSCGGRQ